MPLDGEALFEESVETLLNLQQTEMKKIGLLFPGQGAQTVGMGCDLYESYAPARHVFDHANDQLGYSLTALCFKGPESDLTQTLHAQVAIFVTSLATLAALRSIFPKFKPHLACGLSLGEFTSLVALESISFEEGLNLVRRRAQLMEEACQKQPGTMASLLGFSEARCNELCRETGVELANLNSPEQMVISGPVAKVEKACQVAKAKGAKRVIPLKVSGAFHSSLMEHARAGLEAALAHTEIKAPLGLFIPNVTGTPVSNPDQIKLLLAKQLICPVQWIKTMTTVSESGVTECLEIGPGRVLKGLAKKNNPNLNVTSIATQTELEPRDEREVHFQ